jgi:predicted CopG family antitoxin
MHKELTITIDEQVYEGLHRIVGQPRISQFIGDLVRPHVVDTEPEEAYRQMAEEDARETKALEWAEVTIRDVSP